MKDDQKSKQQLISELVQMRNELNMIKLASKNQDHQFKRKIEEEERRVQKAREAEEEERRLKEQQDAELQSIRDYASWVVYATPALLCSLNPDGTTRFANPACEQMTGFRIDELIGQNWWSLLFPGNEFEQVEKLYRRFKEGDVRDFEMTFTTKTGERKTVAQYSLNRTVNGHLKEVILVGIDVTARKKAESELESSEEKFRRLVSNLPSAVYRCSNDAKRTIHHVNNYIEKITGYSNWDLIENRNFAFSDLIIEEDKEKVSSLIKEGLTDRSPYHLEYRIKHKNGAVRWLQELGQGLFTKEGNLDCLQGAIFDITDRKMMEEKLEETLEKVRNMSLTDELTQLYNRRGFETHGEQQMKIAERNKRGLSVVFVDLNGMKTINDELGHKEGDRALVAASDVLRKTFREADILCRLGGDEFAVLAVETDESSAKVMTDRLQQNVEEFNQVSGSKFRLSLSTGIALYDPHHPTTIQQLLDRADAKMYETKQKFYAEKGGKPR